MNDSANSSKAQIVEKLRSASNILVTVSANPSIDDLSACIAMTLLLNKYKKNATAVFSGKVPAALNFLKPKETIEKNTDSLRDFIIALDKSKADKLRYKVEDDVVKIFITPYRTSITENDLKYSAGDFNVDVIIALGVHHQQDLDRAITAHGRIFHDAVVMSINNVAGGDFGVANWEDYEASSLSELVANLAGELDPSLLDPEIATALLTGIVAETSRFSNEKTHPRTMNVSSQLLEAGADQQLVNTQLQDLIGTVVNLEAGTEIKPTISQTEDSTDHTDVADELVIDDSGSFALPEPASGKDDSTQNDETDTANTDDADTDEPTTAEPLAELDAFATDPTASATMPDPTGPSARSEEAAVTATDNANAAIASMLGTPVESTPTPMLDTPAYEETPVTMPMTKPDYPEQPVAQPAPDDAYAARQAVENALDGPDSGPNRPEELSTQQNQSASTLEPQSPQIQAITPNQPSYANPATTTMYDAPVALAGPQNEPAPLGMSPADQAFTMPLPPISSMPQPAQQPAPGLSLPPANSVATPPPLPPPMMPPSAS